MKRFLRVLVILAFAVFLVGPFSSAQATPYTLIDGNSTVNIDPSNPARQVVWTVDGVDQLWTQWFYFGLGDSPEQSLSTLSSSIIDSSTGGSMVKYNFVGAGFEVDVQYTLDGGPALSMISDLAEQIEIRNTSGNALNFHFFQYSDFDLGGTAYDDNARLVNDNAIKQWDPIFQASETVVTPAPSHYQIDYYNNIIASLTDGSATTLSDSNNLTAGVGDVEWAFQWDFTLTADGLGSAVQISKDKQISAPVPEPATMLLLGSGLIGLAGLGRKKFFKK